MKCFLNRFSLCLSLSIIGLASGKLAAQNQLKNSGFEDGKSGWNIWGGEISSLHHQGNNSMAIELTSPKWSGADQILLLSESINTVDVSGWMKTENVVKGVDDWEMARIAIEFLNESGSQVGGYPPVTAQMQGTSDWTFYKKRYDVPAGAKKVKIQVALGNCTGKAYFDDLEVFLKSSMDENLNKQELSTSNQLKNSGFEQDQSGWTLWGGEITPLHHHGEYSMKIELTSPKWSGADQTLLLSEKVHIVEVSGWMKTENIVKGVNDWEMARIGIEFLNENGSQVGGYPPVVGQMQGYSGWTFYKKEYDVPAGAKKVKVQVALANCTGKAYFDDLEVVLKSSNGEILNKQELSGPMSEGQWYEIKVDINKAGSHYVDWSSLLDAPAGKHGYASVADGHLRFEDGTPAKFWGTNIVANSCFPAKSEADSLALRLSKMGCNLVRLHHMDASWSRPNIFGNTNTTRSLSPESLDKLDYLVAALKKKGIYIFLDLLVNRDFMTSDGIVNKLPELGGKQIAFFDPMIIDLQKEYIKQLLTHKNKYTGLTYVNEPAIVGSEFINESSVFLSFAGDILTEPYRKELEAQFAAAGNQGKKLCAFDLDYGKGAVPVLKEKANTSGDVAASMKFLSQVERKYYKDMYGTMRSLGVKYPLAGSNFPMPLLTYQRDNLENDMIITNDYWDHPQLWKINNDWSKVLYAPINNTSMMRNASSSTISNICKYRWNNKPFMVTEFNDCYPNEFNLEGVPFVAAYSSLQGMDGMLQFDFDLHALGAERMGAFSLSAMPDHLAQWVACAPMFLRGDISPAPGLVLDHIKEEKLFSLPNYSDFLDKNNHLCFITKVAKTLESAEADKVSKYQDFYNPTHGIIKSETGELSLNTQKGILEIHAPKVQGVSGGVKNNSFDFPAFKVSINNTWASIMFVSKDNKPLSESEKFYLVVTAPVKMRDQKYNDSRTGLLNAGQLPLMAQIVDGEILFKTDRQVNVTPLSTDGQKGEAISLVKNIKGSVFDLSKGRTFVYEVELK